MGGFKPEHVSNFDPMAMSAFDAERLDAFDPRLLVVLEWTTLQHLIQWL